MEVNSFKCLILYEYDFAQTDKFATSQWHFASMHDEKEQIWDKYYYSLIQSTGDFCKHLFGSVEEKFNILYDKK